MIDAIEELETYMPLLQNQGAFNQTVVNHLVAALRKTSMTTKRINNQTLNDKDRSRTETT